MNTWINADDLPDWSVWNFVPGDGANYADQGLVYGNARRLERRIPEPCSGRNLLPCKRLL